MTGVIGGKPIVLLLGIISITLISLGYGWTMRSGMLEILLDLEYLLTPLIGICVENYSSREKRNKLIVSSKSSVGGIGIVIQPVSMEVLVRSVFLHADTPESDTANVLGVVHSVSYSLLLLNTDLHIAELASHMSRGQFVRNTLSAVNDQIRPPTSASSPSVSLNPAARSSSPDLTTPQEESPLTRGQSMESTDTGVSTLRMRTKRSGSLHSWKSGSREGFGGLMMGNSSTPQLASSSATTASSFSAPIPQNGSLRIATSGSVTYGRAWENDMETLLKVRFLVAVWGF